MQKDTGNSGALKLEYTIKAHEVDFSDSITPASVFNVLQDASAAHADMLGWGFADLAEEGRLWMLSWLKVEFLSFPGFQQTIHIETWPKDVFKFYGLRDFLISGSENQPLMKATSAWLMIDLKTKRIVNPRELIDSVVNFPERHSLRDLPSKSRQIIDAEPVKQFTAHYSDVDINKHVNNARYVEFIQNCYSADFYSRHRLHSINVLFLAESKMGDTLTFRKLENNGAEGEHFITGTNESSSKQCIQAKMNWQKK